MILSFLIVVVIVVDASVNIPVLTWARVRGVHMYVCLKY